MTSQRWLFPTNPSPRGLALGGAALAIIGPDRVNEFSRYFPGLDWTNQKERGCAKHKAELANVS